MSSRLKSPGKLDDYALQLEVCLDLVCQSCSSRYEASADIRKEEESQAPYGSWALRHAKTSKEARWYVGGEGCFCPACVRKQQKPWWKL